MMLRHVRGCGVLSGVYAGVFLVFFYNLYFKYLLSVFSYFLFPSCVLATGLDSQVLGKLADRTEAAESEAAVLRQTLQAAEKRITVARIKSKRIQSDQVGFVRVVESLLGSGIVSHHISCSLNPSHTSSQELEEDLRTRLAKEQTPERTA